jgi:hypothetical protein
MLMQNGDDRQDPTLKPIMDIIKTLTGDGHHQHNKTPPTASPSISSNMEDIGRDLHAAAGNIELAILSLLAAKRSLAAAQALLMAVDAPDLLDQIARAIARATGAIGASLETRRMLDRYLESVGLPSLRSGPSDEVINPDMQAAVILADATTPDQALQSCLSFLENYLPEPIGQTDSHSSAPSDAVSFCEALAVLAAVLATLANVITGPISLALQSIAKALRAPLVATGAEIALATAKEIAGGEVPGEIMGQISSNKIMDLVPGNLAPGSLELKATAFLLRLTGTIVCLAADRPLAECPCFPDLLSDTGSGVIGSAPD